ncbi:MAG: substrate-binding domain-containing protein [Candidatus Nanopelagicales bacterium]
MSRRTLPLTLAALGAVGTLALVSCSSGSSSGSSPTPTDAGVTSASAASSSDCSSDGSDPAADPAAASFDLQAPTAGPNGETAVSANDITLTPEEIAQVKEKGLTAVMPWAGSGPWYDALTKGASDQFAEMGVDVGSVTSAEFDAAKQTNDIESDMSQNPDIILTLPVDPAVISQALKPAAEKGKVIVFADNGVEGFSAGKDYVGITTGDHFGMGKAAASLMSDAVGGDGQIGIIYHDADFYVTNNRDHSFEAAIVQDYPCLQIVARQGFAEESATGDIASAMLAQNPDLKGIYVAWDTAAESVLEAIRAAGRNDVKVVTYDLGATNDMEMAKGGLLYGTVVDKPYQIGQTMAKLAAYKILGKEAPPFVTVDLIAVTKDNLADAWQESLQEDIPSELAAQLGQ